MNLGFLVEFRGLIGGISAFLWFYTFVRLAFVYWGWVESFKQFAIDKEMRDKLELWLGMGS